MDEKIFKKKRFFFLSVTFFFFVTMLFLYINVSNIMYNNASILLAIKETKNLKNVILSKYRSDKNMLTEAERKDIQSLLTKFDFYPPVIYLKIYSPDNVLLYQLGRDVILETPIDLGKLSKTWITYNKTLIKEEKQTVYEVVVPLDDGRDDFNGYLNILFDLQTVDNTFFNEKRILFLIVFIVNLLILAFMIMMVLNLQKRLFVAENELCELNTSDKVTGLLTKEALFEEMRNEIDRIERNGGRFALITADIDNFIDINEKYGYDFGDHILKTIASVFRECFRKFDFIGRFGGDEIVTVMVGASEEEGYQAADKCRNFIEETKFFFEGKEIPVHMSFGVASSDNVALSDKNSEDSKRNFFRDILFNSLNALSHSKITGKNSVTKHSELGNVNQLKI